MKLEIIAPEGALGKSYLAAPVEVLLDGHPLEGVTDISVEMHTDDIARATVTLLLTGLVVDGVPIEKITKKVEDET